MAYRLYNKDVAEGITDFNDDKYHVLQEGGGYAIILNDHNAEFIVASGLKYHEYNSIDWNQGHYFTDVLEATDFYTFKTVTTRKFLFSDTVPSNKTLKVILDTMMQAREEGNIRETHLEDMLDMTLAFMGDNPELFEEDVIDDLEATLA